MFGASLLYPLIWRIEEGIKSQVELGREADAEPSRYMRMQVV